MPLCETATALSGSAGVRASACLEEEIVETREAPTIRGRGSQLELREELNHRATSRLYSVFSE